MRVRFLTLALGVAALCLAAPDAHAQSRSRQGATRMLSIGPGFAGGASMLLDPAENWKVAPVFAWRGTIDATYPISDVFAATLSLGIDRRGGEFYWYSDKQLRERRMVNYFTVTPGVNIKGFVIGVNLGFPTGGTRTYRDGVDAEERTVALDAEADRLLTLIEPRISGAIPVFDSPLGWLGVTIGAGYALNDMSERPDFAPGETPNRPISTASASAHLGLTWQFGIPGTAR